MTNHVICKGERFLFLKKKKKIHWLLLENMKVAQKKKTDIK